MRNNKTTWIIFVTTFFLFALLRFISIKNQFGISKATFLIVYVAAIFGVLQFFQMTNKLSNIKFLMRFSFFNRFVTSINSGSQLTIFERRVIFSIGFGIGLIILRFF